MRTDIVRMYKDIHSWVGIFAGLFLFTAFYAGALTMFEEPVNQWATPPAALSPPPSLEDTPRLMQATFGAHPEARRQFAIQLNPDPALPARLMWQEPRRRERGVTAPYFASSFAPDGSLETTRLQSSDVAQFIDVLHQQVGLPMRHEISMPFMGAVSLLYAIALVSGLIVLLPSLVKDLFALRLGRNIKRMWLDVHNVLGVFSLPFHIIMAVTAVIFAFHDEIYGVQNYVLYGGKLESLWDRPVLSSHPPRTPLMAPKDIVARLAQDAPGFVPERLLYRASPGGKLNLGVWGYDPRYAMRAPTQGFASVDPYDGKILDADYLPGHAGGVGAVVISFFTLHFGSFGGAPIRWSYFALGLAGAFLFYTGNLLWVESRRRRERNLAREGTATRILDRLTVGWSLSTIAGISFTIAAAKWLPGHVADPALWHRILFYAVFLAGLGWAQLRPAKPARVELLWLCALATALIPLASLSAAISARAWNHGWPTSLVDAAACAGIMFFAFLAVKAGGKPERRGTANPAAEVPAAAE